MEAFLAQVGTELRVKANHAISGRAPDQRQIALAKSAPSSELEKPDVFAESLDAPRFRLDVLGQAVFWN